MPRKHVTYNICVAYEHEQWFYLFVGIIFAVIHLEHRTLTLQRRQSLARIIYTPSYVYIYC